MDIDVIKKRLEGGLFYVTYRYWKTGECACLGKKITRAFAYDPTTKDLINAINVTFTQDQTL